MYTYDEAVKYLLEIPKFTKTKNNQNLKRILENIGNPQDKMKIIHVAGTNGKGSVCAFLNSVLNETGYSVGMFTSPHLVKINERICVNGSVITDDEFLGAFTRIKDTVDKMIRDGAEHPSFFEYIFLVAIAAFDKAHVEYVILETGLGGRLDATNVIEKPIVSIITSVSKDHMEILGDTIEEIAGEKAGIIKEGVPVVFWGENSVVRQVMEKKACEMGAECISVNQNDIKKITKNNNSIDFCLVNSYDKYGCLSIPFVMDYQMWNASLAVVSLQFIIPETVIDEAAIKAGLRKAKWPGRMEQIAHRVYLDGAHNYDGVLQFRNYVNELVEKEAVGIYILFSVVKEKEYHEMMGLIGQIKGCKGFLVAPVMNVRAAATEELKHQLMQTGKEVYAFDSLPEAYRYGLAHKGPNDYLFCVGSLYMVGEIKAAISQEVSHD